MLELLRQRRWLGFTVFAVAMFALCLVLANWQWHRYHERLAGNARLDAALGAAAVPVSDLLAASPGSDEASPLPAELEWRLVTATGRFDEAGEVAVRRRPLDGRNGFWIVTPLATDSGVVLVNRGWVAAGTGATDVVPEVPAPPTGEVTVVGRLRPAEVAGTTEAPPPGQAWAVDPGALVPASTSRYGAYVQLESATPPASQGLTAPLPVPGHRGWNNLLYTFQWLIFAVVGAIGWWRLLRQESQREAQAQAPTPTAEADA